MHSPRLDQYFITNCNQTDLNDSLDNLDGLIDPSCLEAFKNYRNSILWTIENWSQI